MGPSNIIPMLRRAAPIANAIQKSTQSPVSGRHYKIQPPSTYGTSTSMKLHTQTSSIKNFAIQKFNSGDLSRQQYESLANPEYQVYSPIGNITQKAESLSFVSNVINIDVKSIIELFTQSTAQDLIGIYHNEEHPLHASIISSLNSPQIKSLLINGEDQLSPEKQIELITSRILNLSKNFTALAIFLITAVMLTNEAIKDCQTFDPDYYLESDSPQTMQSEYLKEIEKQREIEIETLNNLKKTHSVVKDSKKMLKKSRVLYKSNEKEFTTLMRLREEIKANPIEEKIQLADNFLEELETLIHSYEQHIESYSEKEIVEQLKSTKKLQADIEQAKEKLTDLIEDYSFTRATKMNGALSSIVSDIEQDQTILAKGTHAREEHKNNQIKMSDKIEKLQKNLRKIQVKLEKIDAHFNESLFTKVTRSFSNGLGVVCY